MLTDPQLKSKVDALWDRFWSGGIANPITAIEQMSYLIFLKRLEDMDNARAVAAKRKNETYRSVFSAKGGSPPASQVQGRRAGASGGHGNKPATKTADRECRWSYWSQLPGDQMLKHVRDKVFDLLRNLGSDTSSFTQHMQDAVFVISRTSFPQESINIIGGKQTFEQVVTRPLPTSI
jgi:type I restriction enzyme M protein